MIKTLRITIIYWALMTILLGFIYPNAVRFTGRFFFSEKADGSFVRDQGVIVGSSLIGQSFTSDVYFWGRPSATQPFPYNAQVSQSSHLNPANPVLKRRIEADIKKLNVSDPVPIDLVTTSASGLDPDISPQAAKIQIPRIAKARKLDQKLIELLVDEMTQAPTLGFIGEYRVNVLELNLALDKLKL